MKRALKFLVFSVGYVFAYLFVLIGLLYASSFLRYALPFADVFAFIFGNVLMVGLLIYFRHRTRDRWIRAEAERWLAERSRLLNSAHPWRRGPQRSALWISSGIVLLVFLFFPETAGLVSHLFCGRSIQLNPYSIETPLTWIVANSSNSSAWVIAGKGIGRVGLRPYWQREEPMTEMVFYVTSTPPPTDEFLTHAKVLSEQTLQLGQVALICRDIAPSGRWLSADPNLALILCSTARNDFRASFEGRRSESPAFYDALRSVTLTK